MTELLSDLGPLSLGGAVAIAALALLARFSRTRYGARWRCWVWLLLCLRLAIPVSVDLPEQGEGQRPIQIPTPDNAILYTYEPEEPRQSSPPQTDLTQPGPSVSAPDLTPPLDTKEPAPRGEITLFQAVAALWTVGAAGVLGWSLRSHLRFLRYVRRWSRPVTEPEVIQHYNKIGDLLELQARPALRTCAGLKAPMLAGVVRPVLLLPEDGLAGTALRYSLLHELTHYKRRDIWLKTLALWVNAVHWFNPCMWYMMRLVERDTELACDEAALKKLPREEHRAYGKTILDAVERLKAAN